MPRAKRGLRVARENMKKVNQRRLQLKREREERRRAMGGEDAAADGIKIEQEGMELAVEDSFPNNMTQDEVSAKTTPPPLEIKKMPLAPPPQSPSFCFVCVKPLTSEENRPRVTEAEYICLLTDMLEVARAMSLKYLQRIGEPGHWIGLCHPCLELIKEVERRKELIAKLQEDIKSRQRQIVGKMKASKLNLAVEIGAEGKTYRGKMALETLEKILEAVQRRKYISLFSTLDDNNDTPDPPPVVFKQPRKIPKKPKQQQNVNVSKSGRGRPPLGSNCVKLVPKKISPNGHRKWGRPKKSITTVTVDSTTAAPIPPKSEEWMDSQQQEDPDPLFATQEMDDDDDDDKIVPDVDPLALNDDDEEAAILEEPSSSPLDFADVKPSSTAIACPTYYCGLCVDEQTYSSEEQLQLHTNQVHLPTRPSSSSPPKKRQRKENSSGSSRKIGTGSRPPPKKKANSSTGFMIGDVDLTGSDLFDDAGDDGHEEKTEGISEGRKKEKVKRGKYDCPNCPGVKNYGANRFAQHLAIHQRRPFRCSICSGLFPQVQLAEHWNQKHADNTELCPQDKFKKVALDPGEIWKCEGCTSTGFRTEDARDVHELGCSALNRKMKTCGGDLLTSVFTPPSILPYSCQICAKPFRNIEEWRLHRVLHHPDVDRLSCLLCDLSFAEKTVEGVEILRHDLKMLSHVRQLHHGPAPARLPPGGRIHDECEECGLVFKYIFETPAHFLHVHGTSKGGKIVPCSVSSCATRFTSYVSMRRHVHLLHFRAGVAVCDICGVSFQRAESLVEHKLQKHGTLQEDYSPVYDCPVEGCGFRTVKSSAMALHSQMAHGAARKHVCKTCGKGFANSGKLRVHEHIHENKEKRPYQCEICGNSFAVRNYLYIHMRLSHEGRTFPSTNRKRGPKKLKKKMSETEEQSMRLMMQNAPQPQQAPEQYLPTTDRGGPFFPSS